MSSSSPTRRVSSSSIRPARISSSARPPGRSPVSAPARVIAGQVDVAERLRAREQSVLYRRRSGVTPTAPVIHADNHSSRRYTILDLVADNALGLLHRVSGAISRHGCDVDLVLISTEGQKAIDVFHITRNGAKLTDEAIAGMTADIHRTLEG